MNKYIKQGLAVLTILLSVIIISAGSVKITSAVHIIEENKSNKVLEENKSNKVIEDDYKKTDIAQIIITTGSIITREEYAKATVAIVDATTGTSETIIDDNAEIRKRGNSTSMLAKLPYNIKLSSSESVLGMGSGKKWCLLANYLDTSLMRNKLAYDFAKTIGLAYSCDSRYAEVWLNGTNLGNYLITVPIRTGKNGVDIDTNHNEFLLEVEEERAEGNTTYISSGIYRLKCDEPETLTQNQEQWLSDFLTKAESAMESGNDTEIRKYVDVDSFIDFYIVQELFKNVDVNYSSTRFYIKNNKIYAGPLWDFDLSSGNVSTNQRYPNYLIYNNYYEYGNGSGNSYEGLWALYSGKYQNFDSSWIGILMRGDKFRATLYKRYIELQNQIVNLYQDNTIGMNQMDLLLNQYGSSFARNNEKWPVEKIRNSPLYRDNESTYRDSVSFLRSWLMNRNQWLLEAMSE